MKKRLTNKPQSVAIESIKTAINKLSVLTGIQALLDRRAKRIETARINFENRVALEYEELNIRPQKNTLSQSELNI